MRTWERLAGLAVQIERVELAGARLELPGFTRRTSVVRLAGGGLEGVGEDVTYGAPEQAAFQAAPRPALAGRWSLAELSERLGALELFGAPPSQEAYLHYRRWALESAALDLALRQAGRSLAGALGREVRPLRFAVSPRLGDPPRLDALRPLLDAYPGLELKLDATSSWTEAFADELAATGRVATIDLKGAYRGTPVDQEADPRLYRLVLERFPRAWIEDPAVTAATAPLLEVHWERVTWDAPLHSLADIERLEHRPRCVNVKPSRFGTLESLCDVYDALEREGIGAYGGGQFELGPGRGQIQLLSALLHPDAPNDVAPIDFNLSDVPPGLPSSPLVLAPAPTGFGLQSESTEP